MNDTIIAAKAKEQHDKFMGKVFTHFSKPKARFVRETTYGIQASGDTKLSSVVRAIDDDVEPIQTEKRLSRNIEDEHLGDAVAQAILAEGANLVKAEILSCASSPAAFPQILKTEGSVSYFAGQHFVFCCAPCFYGVQMFLRALAHQIRSLAR